jgi:hypothetical protein
MPPALVTAATTSRQCVKAKMGKSTPVSAVSAVRMVRRLCSVPAESPNPLQHRRVRVVQEHVQRMRREGGEAVGRKTLERAREAGAVAGRPRGKGVGLTLVPARPGMPAERQRERERREHEREPDQPGVGRRRGEITRS